MKYVEAKQTIIPTSEWIFQSWEQLRVDANCPAEWGLTTNNNNDGQVEEEEDYRVELDHGVQDYDNTWVGVAPTNFHCPNYSPQDEEWPPTPTGAGSTCDFDDDIWGQSDDPTIRANDNRIAAETWDPTIECDWSVESQDELAQWVQQNPDAANWERSWNEDGFVAKIFCPWFFSESQVYARYSWERADERIIPLWMHKTEYAWYTWETRHGNILEPWLFDEEYHCQRGPGPWHVSFTCFRKLPPELQLLIWDSVLPSAPAANYFTCDIVSTQSGKAHYEVQGAQDCRDRSTYIMRDVLSQVCRQTRAYIMTTPLIPLDIMFPTYGKTKDKLQEWRTTADNTKEVEAIQYGRDTDDPDLRRRRIFLNPKRDIVFFEFKAFAMNIMDLNPSLLYRFSPKLKALLPQLVHIGLRPHPYDEGSPHLIKAFMECLIHYAQWHSGPRRDRHFYLFDTEDSCYPNTNRPAAVERNGLALRHRGVSFDMDAIIEDTNGPTPITWTGSLTLCPLAKDFGATDWEAPVPARRNFANVTWGNLNRKDISPVMFRALQQKILQPALDAFRMFRSNVFQWAGSPKAHTAAEKALVMILSRVEYPVHEHMSFFVHLLQPPAKYGQRYRATHDIKVWLETQEDGTDRYYDKYTNEWSSSELQERWLRERRAGLRYAAWTREIGGFIGASREDGGSVTGKAPEFESWSEDGRRFHW